MLSDKERVALAALGVFQLALGLYVGAGLGWAFGIIIGGSALTCLLQAARGW